MSPYPHQIEPTTVHPRSPATRVSITFPHSLLTDSQLAILHSKPYHEIDSLKRDLSTTRKRAERAERLVILLTKPFPKPLPQENHLTAL
jgi:hypothetical protein